MAQGKVVEVGTHEELLAANGRYAALYAQGRDEEPQDAEEPRP